MASHIEGYKIAVLGSTYPRYANDPAVPWLRESVNRSAASGNRITVIAPSYKGLGNHEIDGTQVLRWRYGKPDWETLTHDEGAPAKSRSILYKLLAIPYILCGIVAVFQWTRKYKFDIIHCHWPFPHGLMVLLPKWFLGTKIVSTCHGAELAMGRNSFIIRKILAYVMKQGDGVVANSSHTRNEILKVLPCDVDIVPYGSTTKDSPTLPLPLNDDQKIPLLLFCGRLIQRKGIHYLLKALTIVLPTQPVQLVITGEGDRKNEWMALSSALGLHSFVEFAGFVSNERLGELYAQCDIYVHPAIFDDNGDTEGLGVVLVEALAHARPVIASGVGGIVDVIKHGRSGILVMEKNEEALAFEILRLLNDRPLREKLSVQGFDFARQYFCWDRINDKLNNVYHRISGDDSYQELPTLDHKPVLDGDEYFHWLLKEEGEESADLHFDPTI